MTVKLMIIDGHELVRAGLREILRDTKIKIVHQTDQLPSALSYLASSPVDVILLGVAAQDTETLELLASLRAKHPDLKVLVFANQRNSALMAKVMARGAAGVALKEAGRTEIVEAINTVATGKELWSRDELRRASSASSANVPGAEAQLTRRETEVLIKMMDGLTNKQIAVELKISYETVKEHVQHILSKIGVSDRTQAAVWAVRQGLV